MLENTSDLVLPRIIDVDVGVFRQTLNTPNFLVTFDPFQRLAREAHTVRLPYAVSTQDGYAQFNVNTRIKDCSSLNNLNPYFRRNTSAMDERIEGCRNQPGYNPYASRVSFIRNCRNFRNLRGQKVRTVDLTSFLHKAGVRRVEWLKIDAQGSDSILTRSLLDSRLIHVQNVQLECQYEARIPRQYEVENDCAQMEAYFRERHFRVRAHVSNCAVGEYDLVASRNASYSLALFPQRWFGR